MCDSWVCIACRTHTDRHTCRSSVIGHRRACTITACQCHELNGPYTAISQMSPSDCKPSAKSSAHQLLPVLQGKQRSCMQRQHGK